MESPLHRLWLEDAKKVSDLFSQDISVLGYLALRSIINTGTVLRGTGYETRSSSQRNPDIGNVVEHGPALPMIRGG